MGRLGFPPGLKFILHDDCGVELVGSCYVHQKYNCIMFYANIVTRQCCVNAGCNICYMTMQRYDRSKIFPMFSNIENIMCKNNLPLPFWHYIF